ncbi:MAG: leucine-rich repeat domain-containing protein [Treponema sp.]|nr:leucine-rich repeat domain-containing protein [Treponema sp.]
MNKIKVSMVYLILVFVSFFILLFFTFLTSKSYYNSEKDFQFVISPDGKSVEIVNYIGEKKEKNVIRIPPKINNMPVTRIGENAFNGIGLADILIPDNVLYIGNYAFSGNRSVYEMYIRQGGNIMLTPALAASSNWLNKINIPENVTFIGEGAFLYNMIVEIKIGENVTLGGETRAAVFSNNFDVFYNENGRKAGTYYYRNNIWTAEYK